MKLGKILDQVHSDIVTERETGKLYKATYTHTSTHVSMHTVSHNIITGQTHVFLVVHYVYVLGLVLCVFTWCMYIYLVEITFESLCTHFASLLLPPLQDESLPNHYVFCREWRSPSHGQPHPLAPPPVPA